MYLEKIESVFELWNEFSILYNGLKDIKKNYVAKLGEVAQLLDEYEQKLATQKCQLGVIDQLLKRIHVPEEKKISIEQLKMNMDKCMKQLMETEVALNKENKTPLEDVLENIKYKMLIRNNKVLPLCQLPPSVLESIALSLPVTTIKALKCSSKYFCSALDTKKVWSKLLYYPERYYKSDLLSGCTSAGVVEAVNMMCAGERQWRAYYKLQQARTQLTHRDLRMFEEVVLPFEGISQMLELVTVDGQRWVFIIFPDESKLCIYNVTSRARVHDILPIPDVLIILLNPQGYVVMRDEQTDTFYIYEFQKPDYRLRLMYMFRHHEKEGSIWRPPTPLPPLPVDWFWNLCMFCGAQDVFVVADREFDTLEELFTSLIHVWSLSTGRRRATVSLHTDIVNRIQSVVTGNDCETIMIDIPQTTNDSSNIVISFVVDDYWLSTIFNVKSCTFTHICPDNSKNHFDISYDSNYVYADRTFCQYGSATGNSKLTVYSIVNEGMTHEELQEIKVLKSYDSTDIDNVLLKDSKMIIARSNNVISIVSLEDDSLSEVQVTVEPGLELYGFIVPNFLFLSNVDDDNSKALLIYDITSGTNIWTYEISKEGHEDFVLIYRYYQNLTYPSKIGVLNGTTLRFYFVD